MTNFNDTFMYTLVITLFGMGIVFIVLVVLQYILKSMKLFFYKENNKDAEVTQVKEEVATAVPQVSANEAVLDEELVAVITAAVMSCLGGTSNIIVKSIRRTDDLTPVWGKVSRTEQMANRF